MQKSRNYLKHSHLHQVERQAAALVTCSCSVMHFTFASVEIWCIKLQKSSIFFLHMASAPRKMWQKGLTARVTVKSQASREIFTLLQDAAIMEYNSNFRPNVEPYKDRSLMHWLAHHMSSQVFTRKVSFFISKERVKEKDVGKCQGGKQQRGSKIVIISFPYNYLLIFPDFL